MLTKFLSAIAHDLTPEPLRKNLHVQNTHKQNKNANKYGIKSHAQHTYESLENLEKNYFCTQCKAARQ